MNKFAALISATAIAAVSSVVIAAPAGFGNAQSTPGGFDKPNNAVTTVQEVIKNGYDDQVVTLTGKLTNYLGQDKYEFSDNTGKICVELDDDRNWSHVRKDQLITINAEVDREVNNVELSVKSAVPAM